MADWKPLKCIRNARLNICLGPMAHWQIIQSWGEQWATRALIHISSERDEINQKHKPHYSVAQINYAVRETFLWFLHSSCHFRSIANNHFAFETTIQSCVHVITDGEWKNENWNSTVMLGYFDSCLVWKVWFFFAAAASHASQIQNEYALDAGRKRTKINSHVLLQWHWG